MRLLLLLPIVLLLAPVALIAGILSKPVQRTRGEVADTIEKFISGTCPDMEWDEFSCVRIADSRLDEIRKTCVVLPDTHPSAKPGYTNEAGFELLRSFVRELRSQ